MITADTYFNQKENTFNHMETPEMRALLLQKFEDKIRIPVEFKTVPKVEAHTESVRSKKQA